jgi:putative FmdB family regulatory protein
MLEMERRAERGRPALSEGTMPLYEYLCNACAHRFERIVKFSDPPLKTCPLCGRDAIHQLISAPAVHFKGSGWYVTDYAHKNSALSSTPPAKSEGGPDTVSASKDSGSSSPSAPPSFSSDGKSSGADGAGGNTSSAGSPKTSVNSQ